MFYLKDNRQSACKADIAIKDQLVIDTALSLGRDRQVWSWHLFISIRSWQSCEAMLDSGHDYSIGNNKQQQWHQTCHE